MRIPLLPAALLLAASAIVLPAQDGVLGLYFTNPDLSGLGCTRVDAQVNLAPGSKAPAPGLPTTKYSVRFQGFIIPKSSETYTFSVTHNDGVRLWLDGRLAIDSWLTTSTTPTHTATAALVLGTPAPFILEFHHQDGTPKCQLYWQAPVAVKSKVLIPTTSLSPFVDAAPPSVPGMPSVSLLTDRLVALTWAPASDDTAVASYVVEKDGVELGPVRLPFLRDLDVAPGSTHHYRVRAIDSAGTSSPFGAPLTVSIPSEAQATGVTGVYFKNKQLNDVGTVRIDPVIDLASGYTAPAPNLPNEDYSVCWQGWVLPAVSEVHTFTLSANDGVRLWLGDRLAVNSWKDINGTQTCTATAALVASEPIRFKLEYYQDGGGSQCHLYWQSRSLAKELIPSIHLRPLIDAADPGVPSPALDFVADRTAILSWPACSDDVLVAHYVIERDGEAVGTSPVPSYRDPTLTASSTYAYRVRTVDVNGRSSGLSAPVAVSTLPPVQPGSGTGLSGTYFNDLEEQNRVLTRLDPQVAFQWGQGSPAPQVNVDDFTACWQGWVEPFYDEAYTFELQYDNGVRLWVNDQIVVESWGRQEKHGGWLGETMVKRGTVTLVKGVKAKLRLDLCDIGGPAEVTLRWESRSQPLEAIPSSQLYPAIQPDVTAIQLAVPASSRTSPAWLEGAVGDYGALVSARADDQALVVERENAQAWFLQSAAGVMGVTLHPSRPVALELESTDGLTSASATASLVWQVTDLAGLDYGLENLRIRAGDSLLLTASGNGQVLELLQGSNGATPAVVCTGIPGQAFPLAFAAGVHALSAQIDGVEVGRLTVTAYGADFRGPVACEITYKRVKDIGLFPLPTVAGDVVFTSNDPFRLAVSVAKDNADGKQLYLCPYFRGTPKVQARLGGPTGPIIAQQEVDEFRIWSTAEKVVGIVQRYPDGSAKVSAYLLQEPLIRDLEIKLRIFISGATFFDTGTINKTMYTNDFEVQGERGRQKYYILRGPGVNPLSCHTIHVYQNGVLCSWP